MPAEIRILKLTEEVGEAAEALIGMLGLNSRKGVCRTRDDLLDELADVIITAAVAMCGISEGGPGRDADEASRFLPGLLDEEGRFRILLDLEHLRRVEQNDGFRQAGNVDACRAAGLG